MTWEVWLKIFIAEVNKNELQDVYSDVHNKRAARLLILKEIFLPTWPY